MIDATVNAKGDLELTIPDVSDRDYLREHAERGYWSNMADAFERYSCNGSYTHFDASDANPFVGLTSAPCVAEAMNIDDRGNASIDGALWYFSDYAIENDLERLVTGDTVTYTRYRDE